MQIPESELILNPDGSIYHLNLHPEDIADTIIFVGDPDRVSKVSKYFDSIELKKGKREFITHTGTLNSKRISVVSTGIGTDNIDIVLNELDALVNIDLYKREAKQNHTPLNIIRIGTTGALQPAIGVDQFVMSEYAMGLDGLLYFYDSRHVQQIEMQKAFKEYANWHPAKADPYIVKYDEKLGAKLKTPEIHMGFTVTAPGFYGPQSRKLRSTLDDEYSNDTFASFDFNGLKITNLEMETAGIYGLAKLLGHRAVSMNCVLANRSNKTFSKEPYVAIDRLIKYTLDKLVL
ncbi:nucleoside phosphorylase [Leptobacterium sp. I13]|uniref:nucleoside phosphorylase n=1 Tax=Leptobacterium meishanense TaxID=3128904 RepID=UPI0030EDB051